MAPTASNLRLMIFLRRDSVEKKNSRANWVLLMTEELSSKLFTKLIAKLRKEKGGRE